MIKITLRGIPSKNEQEVLQGFINQYNYDFKSGFILKSAPEQLYKNSPQPELIYANSTVQMVVERKTIVWPLEQIRDHSLWHMLNDFLLQKLLPHLTDDLYVFETYHSDFALSKNDLVAAATLIAEEILDNYLELPEDYQIYDNKPLRWRFYRFPELDRDDTALECGLVFRSKINFNTYTDSERRQVQVELSSYIAKLYQAIVNKFTDYESYLRVLVLEPYTESIGIKYADIVQAFYSTPVPKEIDKVWLAEALETDENQLVPLYNLMYCDCYPKCK